MVLPVLEVVCFRFGGNTVSGVGGGIDLRRLGRPDPDGVTMATPLNVPFHREAQYCWARELSNMRIRYGPDT